MIDPDIGPSLVPAKPKKDDYTVRLSTFYAAIARDLSTQQDKAFAEILGDAVELGLAELVERSNKMNIWKRTSLKASIIAALDAIPQDRLEEAIQALRLLADEQR